MGNASLKERVVTFLKDHAHVVVKDVPWEDLIRLLLLRKTLRLDCLELQERALQSLGVFLPIAVDAAWLEDVVITQGAFMQLRVEARCLRVQAEMSRPAEWLQEADAVREAAAGAKAPRLAAHEAAVRGAALPGRLPRALGGFLQQAPLELEIDVGGAELVLGDSRWRPAAAAKLVVEASRLGTAGPLRLAALLNPDMPVCDAHLRVENASVHCRNVLAGGIADGSPMQGTALNTWNVDQSCARVSRRVAAKADLADPSKSLLFGPCALIEADVQLSASQCKGPIVPGDIGAGCQGEVPPQVCVSVRIADCGDGLHVSQAQLVHLLCFYAAWKRWASFIRGLALPPPTVEECRWYRRRWLERLTRQLCGCPGMCKSPLGSDGEQEEARDPDLVSFELANSLQEVIRQRQLALAYGLSDCLSQEPIGSDDDPSFAAGQQSEKSARYWLGGVLQPSDQRKWPEGDTPYSCDMAIRRDFLLQVDIQGMAAELCLDESCPVSIPGDNDSNRCSAASLRLRTGSARSEDSCVQLVLRMNNIPSSAPISAQVALSKFWIEADTPKHGCAVLIQHAGSLSVNLDLFEHTTGQLWPVWPQWRSNVRIGRLHGHMDADVVVSAMDLAFCVLDLIQGHSELLDPDLETGDGVESCIAAGALLSTSESRPQPGQVPVDFHASSDEPVLVVLTGAGAGGVLAVQFSLGRRAAEHGQAGGSGSDTPGSLCHLASSERSAPASFASVNVCVCELVAWVGPCVDGYLLHMGEADWSEVTLKDIAPLLECDEVALTVGPSQTTVHMAPAVLQLPATGLQFLGGIVQRWREAWVDSWQDDWWVAWCEAIAERATATPKSSLTSDGTNGTSRSYSLLLLVPSVETFFLVGQGETTAAGGATLRLKNQSLDLCLQEDLHAMACTYTLQHVSLSDSTGQQHLLHCGSPNDGPKAITVSAQFQRDQKVTRVSQEEVVVNCTVAPLWTCAHWQTIAFMIDYMITVMTVFISEIGDKEGAAVRETFQSELEKAERLELEQPGSSSSSSDNSTSQKMHGIAGHEEMGPSWSSGMLGILPHVNFRFQLAAQQFLMMLPCAGSEGMLFCCKSHASAAASGMRLVVSHLSLSPAVMPQHSEFRNFLLPNGPQPSAAFIVHPARLTLSLSLPSRLPACVCAQLLAAPVRVSLRSDHLSLALGLHSSIARLFPELRSTGSLGGEPAAAPRVLVFGIARGLVNTISLALDGWALQLRACLPIIRVGIIHSPSDTELLTLLAEDISVSVRRNTESLTPSRNYSKLSTACSVEAGTSGRLSGRLAGSGSTHTEGHASQASTPAPEAATDCHLLTFSSRVGALSIENTATDTAKLMPLLEPIHVAFTHHPGFFSEPSKCSVSWLNFNVSMALVDTLVDLIQGASSVLRPAADGWGEPCAAPAPRKRGTGRVPRRASEDFSRDTLRQHSISVRQPQLKFHNQLGQGIQIILGQGGEAEEFLDHGESWNAPVPWHAFAGEEKRDGEASVRFVLREETIVKFRIAPTPSIQALPVQPVTALARPSRSPHPQFSLNRSFSGSRSNLSNSIPCNCCWMLVRRRVSGMLNQLDIQLSSVIFLENRTALSVSVAPLEGGAWMELPAGAEPQPVPLSWCVGRAPGHRPPMLWCGLTSEIGRGCQSDQQRTCRWTLKRRGVLQPLLSRGAWRSLHKYRSMVVDDYYLRARELDLHDFSGNTVAHLSATVYGVSADLHAPTQALFFSVAIEPMVQFSNRLCYGLELQTDRQALAPGEDADLLCLSEPLSLAIRAPSGTLRLQEQIWADRLRKDGHQRRLFFHEAPDSEASFTPCSADAGVSVILATEPGLSLPEWWAPLQIHQYSPRARRLVIFTHYWLVNRRIDCSICVPRRRHPSGVAKLSEQERSSALRQIDCNEMRMLSDDHHIHKGHIQVGVCGLDSENSVTSFVPLTEPFRVDQPTRGAVTVQRSRHNPTQRCFGYSVHPAPLPFYRTLVIEIVRRYTLLNHKQHTLFCRESDQQGLSKRLPPKESVPFDPQGTNMQLAITGMEAGHDQEGFEPEQEACGYSALFGLCVEEDRTCLQLMHRVDVHAAGPSALLVRPEPIEGPVQEPADLAWCLTTVDIRVESSSAVVRFADPLRPDFRIINRTGHQLDLSQAGVGTPRFALPSEHRMSFSWFQPGGPKRLQLSIGSQTECYDIGVVQRHKPSLLLERPPKAGEVSGWHEEFHVCTRVHRGSREVHIHPWCRLVNRKGDALVVRKAHSEGQGRLVQSGESVCLQPEPSGVLSVQVRCSSVQGRSAWSQPIRLAKVLAGSKGYLRHLKHGGVGLTSIFDITAVAITCDPLSDFLLVELKPYVESACPYLLENMSSQEVLVTQAGDEADGIETSLMPGERFPFLPLGLGNCQGGCCRVRLRAMSDVESPSTGTVIDIESPQEVHAELLHISVLKERPRRVVIQDGVAIYKASRTHLKPPVAVFPALLLGRRIIPCAAPQKAWFAGKGCLGDSLPSSLNGTTQLPSARLQQGSDKQVGSSPDMIAPSKDVPWKGMDESHKHIGSGELRLPRFPRPTLPCKAYREALYAQKSVLESPRLSPSMVKMLQRGSEDVFWQRSPMNRKPTRRSRHFAGRDHAELHIAGFGVSLIDNVALQEVAYFSAECLDIKIVRHRSLRRVLDLTLLSFQLDVMDGTGWSSSMMLRPRRGPLQTRGACLDMVPFVSLHVQWLAVDGGAGNAAHLEVECLSLEMLDMEVRLDTMNCFRLAQWALELNAHAAPVLGRVQPLLQASCTGEQLPAVQAPSSSDRVFGEPQCNRPDDFAEPTPVFIRRLFLHKVQFVLSVRFSGKRVSDCQGNEELQALHHVLRKLIPFDVSQACIVLGANLPHRPTIPMDFHGACLRDEFLPRGIKDRLAGAVHSCTATVLRQVPRLLGAQRLLGSPVHLCSELARAAQLFLLGMRSCDPWAMAAAFFMGLAALFESAEGILTVLTKTACRMSAGAVPSGLWKEPSGIPGALMDLIWYGFPWHFRQSYREWRRQMHIACSSQSWTLTLCSLLQGIFYSLASVGSALLLTATKLLQVAHLANSALARYTCPKHVAELGAASARRMGPTLFRLGVPLQFSHDARAALMAVLDCTSGTRHCDWRLLPLPHGEGTMVAAQGSGFFLVRARGSRCLPVHAGSLCVAWKACGTWQDVELAPSSVITKSTWILRLRPPDCGCSSMELRLRSSEAAFAAFGFIQECLAGWAEVEVHASCPVVMSASCSLLRRVRRSAKMRASR